MITLSLGQLPSLRRDEVTWTITVYSVGEGSLPAQANAQHSITTTTATFFIASSFLLRPTCYKAGPCTKVAWYRVRLTILYSRPAADHSWGKQHCQPRRSPEPSPGFFARHLPSGIYSWRRFTEVFPAKPPWAGTGRTFIP